MDLMEQEAELFRKLVGAVDGTNIVVRACGGWVRDKLLGRESDDIDMVLEGCSGVEFKDLLLERGVIESAGVIRMNPEKSKHLETVVIHVQGLSIDLVQLREEVYGMSRIPIIVPSDDPVKDAFRRDLTINSLFYNLHTDEVEDFTGRGLADLHEGIIRTPTDPTSIFLEDPLRVIRTVRFTAQLGFVLDDSIQVNDSVLERFQEVVALERVHREFRKLLHAPHYMRGLVQLIDWKLLDCLMPGVDWSPIYGGQDWLRKMDGDRLCLYTALFMVRASVEPSNVDGLLGDWKYTRQERKKISYLVAGLTGFSWDMIKDVFFVVQDYWDDFVCLAARLYGRPTGEVMGMVMKIGEIKDRSLPVSGSDLIEMGYVGSEIGVMLKLLWGRWIDHPEWGKEELLDDLKN